MGLLFSMTFLVGCSHPKQTQTQTKQKPGLYSLTGWNHAWMNTSTNVANGIDVEGRVGYPLEVAAPTANCGSPTKNWTGYHRIISGELPPGIDIEEASTIKGIPTKRGHYIVVLELYEIKCNDMDYGSMKQELRFHITGSGIVDTKLESEKKELASDDKVKISYTVTPNAVKFFIKTNGSPSISVDVNKNGNKDGMVDRSYGMSDHKQLCTQYYLEEEGYTTTCGGAPSKAKLSAGVSEYVFTIPKDELTTRANPGTISVMIKVGFNENDRWTWIYYPYSTRIFQNVYEIDIR
ncbi:MAG TPA: hypothetical protein VK483_16325 [Chitinophagaceae bacterium]|nr:hypothetical protein [Chitinophagaceae bacterium]